MIQIIITVYYNYSTIVLGAVGNLNKANHCAASRPRKLAFGTGKGRATNITRLVYHKLCLSSHFSKLIARNGSTLPRLSRVCRKGRSLDSLT